MLTFASRTSASILPPFETLTGPPRSHPAPRSYCSPARTLIAARAWASNRIYWGYRTTAQREKFAHELVSLVLTFTESGYLIAAAAEQGIEVYTMLEGRLSLVAKPRSPSSTVVHQINSASCSAVRVYKIAS